MSALSVHKHGTKFGHFSIQDLVDLIMFATNAEEDDMFD